jgi:oxaloacetate decarboxylase beta subunit
MLMLGNLFKESGVVDRLVKTSQNELMNVVIIMLGMAVGATAKAENFLSVRTLMIIGLGLAAFMLGTACGVLFGKLMCAFGSRRGKKTNPLIGSAGVSALPMAARVAQKVGQEADPNNHLLMHAMGPTVSAIIGSAVAAGILFSLFG